GAHTSQTYRAYIITAGHLTLQDGVMPSAGISSNMLAEIVAHEFGHTLGFGHSTDSTALMYPSVTGLGPSLRADDQVAARWLYPNGSVTPPPPPSTPAAPTGLTAAPSASTANLQWNDNATNETGYRVYLASGNGAFSRLSPDLAAGTRAATISSLAAGTYRFYVTAFNTAGESTASNTASATIGSSVAASFTVNPSAGVAGVTTFFCTDTSTGATSWSWNFGDGTSSNLQNPVKHYTVAGNYPVTLTVSTSTGLQSINSHSVSVTTAIPSAPPVSAAFAISPSTAAVRANVAFTDQSTGSPTSWQWNFGDGSTSNVQNPSHAYATQGSYGVS